MATGVVQNNIVPYKAGDSFFVASAKGSYTGFLASTTTVRTVIPLTKPAEPNLKARITGEFTVRAFNSSGGFTLTRISDISVTGDITECGIAVDISSSTALGILNSVASVGSSGITVTFVSA